MIFDKIYVLSLISNKDRQEFIKYEMNDLSINFEFIYGTDFYNLTNDAKNNKIIYPNVWPIGWENNPTARDFGCVINHYNAILYAYELGFNNVLVIEDDICLIKNKKLIINSFNNIPDDADFVTWDTRFYDNKIDKYSKLIKNSNEYFVKTDNADPIIGGMMYALMNRNIMKTYLDSQRTNLTMSDNIIKIFNNLDSKLNRYISTKCLCTDQHNIETNFNPCHFVYINVYKKINNNISINDFYIPEKFMAFSKY